MSNLCRVEYGTLSVAAASLWDILGRASYRVSNPRRSLRLKSLRGLLAPLDLDLPPTSFALEVASSDKSSDCCASAARLLTKSS